MRTRIIWSGILLSSIAIGLSFAQTSYRGTFRISVDTPEKAARSTEEENIWTYLIRDAAGNVVTEIRRVMPFDVAAPEAVVFEDGRVLLLHSFDAYAELFDNSGDMIKRIALLTHPSPDYERVVRSAVHESEAIVGITTGDGGVRIVAIDTDGRLTERRLLEAMSLTGVAVSEDPSLIGVGTMSWRESVPDYQTTIVQGDEAWSVSGGFTTGVFRDDARFYGHDSRGITVVSVRDRSVEWSERVPRGRMIVDAAVTDKGVTMLVADKPQWRDGGWLYSAPLLRTLDSSGAVRTSRDLSSHTFRKGTLDATHQTPAVVLDGIRIE